MGGKFSREFENGSDSLSDFECEQCLAEGSDVEAVHFCHDCNEFLCEVCGRYHIRNMKDHNLDSVASFTQLKEKPATASPVPVVAKCHYHPDRDIEMYCGEHDMVYCSLCIAKEHRSCLNVSEIAAKAPHLSVLESLVADINKVNEQLYDTKLEKSNNLKLIKDKKSSLLQEINAVRKRMNEHLDALEQKIITELEEEQNKLEKEIVADINVADDLIIATDERKPDLTTKHDDKHMFIIEKLGQAVLKDAQNFLKRAHSKSPKLQFESNDIIDDVIEKLDSMGKIITCDTSQKQRSSDFNAKAIAKINIRENSDKNECCINDMCQLPDGTILLIDYSNYRLKRLDDQLKLKDFCEFEAQPMSLCSVSPTEVAVKLKDKTIQFIHIGQSMSFEQNVSKSQVDNIAGGMARCGDQVWIAGDQAVDIYSISGSLVKKVETDSQGQKIFPKDKPGQVAVSKDESNVFVAASGVVVFNSNGDHVNELRDPRLDGALSLCITEDDIVLVAGSYTRNVVMFDRDGYSLAELVSSKDMLSEPESLCYDRQKCRFLVGYDLDEVQVFQFNK